MDNVPVTPTKDNGNKQTIIILFSLVGVLCIILLCSAAGIYNINKSQQSNIATSQANATSTVVFHKTQVAGYDLFDSFDDNRNNWRQGQENNEYWYGDIDIRDGMYIWDLKGFYHSVSQTSWSTYQESKPLLDFDLSVDTKLATPKAKDICFAIAFRANPNVLATNGYEFHVCDTQKFVVGYYAGTADETKNFINWTQSSAIYPGEWNTLGITARGDQFVLSINNTIVYEFTDSTSSSGYVYLMIRYYDQIPGTVLFDNFGLQPR